MPIKILFFTYLLFSAASAEGCCRNVKFFQFRRPNILPIYDTPSASDSVLDDQVPFSPSTAYSPEPFPKYESSVNRYYPTYMEPKAITQKCICSKPMSSQRPASTPSRYYRRNYYSDAVFEDIALRPGPHCGQYGECGQYGPGSQPSQYNACGVTQTIFRQASHRIFPMSFPTSCIC